MECCGTAMWTFKEMQHLSILVLALFIIRSLLIVVNSRGYPGNTGHDAVHHKAYRVTQLMTIHNS